MGTPTEPEHPAVVDSQDINRDNFFYLHLIVGTPDYCHSLNN